MYQSNLNKGNINKSNKKNNITCLEFIREVSTGDYKPEQPNPNQPQNKPKQKKPITFENAEKKRIKHEKRMMRLALRKEKRVAKKAVKAEENQQKMKAGIPLKQKAPKGRWFNVKMNQCEVDGCSLNAFCGLSYKRAVRCPGHRTPLMYYVLNTKCIFKGCSSKAVYGYNYWAKFCREHKEESMMYCMKAHKSAVSEQLASIQKENNIRANQEKNKKEGKEGNKKEKNERRKGINLDALNLIMPNI